MVITISHMGYIKRTPLTDFRRQNRGGTGSKGGTTRDEDFIEHLYVATMHNTMLFFTSKGKCYWLKVYEIPEGSRTSKGRALQNLINIESDDKVKAFINVKNLDDPEYINNNFIVLCSTKGLIKKTSLEAYSRPRSNGINAITVRENDELLEARMTNGSHQIMLAVKSGRAIRFPESYVRPMGRTASGVRGIKLDNDETDMVIGMITVEDREKDVFVVSENGYGKRSSIDDYRVTNRGGKGVKTINITEKTGNLIALKDVTDDDDLMIITQQGNILRSPVASIRVMGRATQGVRLINLKENDTIASVAIVEVDENEDDQEMEITDNNEINDTTDTNNLEIGDNDPVN
jgi:DNA gyrase subunit A